MHVYCFTPVGSERPAEAWTSYSPSSAAQQRRRKFESHISLCTKEEVGGAQHHVPIKLQADASTPQAPPPQACSPQQPHSSWHQRTPCDAG